MQSKSLEASSSSLGVDFRIDLTKLERAFNAPTGLAMLINLIVGIGVRKILKKILVYT